MTDITQAEVNQWRQFFANLATIASLPAIAPGDLPSSTVEVQFGGDSFEAAIADITQQLATDVELNFLPASPIEDYASATTYDKDNGPRFARFTNTGGTVTTSGVEPGQTATMLYWANTPASGVSPDDGGSWTVFAADGADGANAQDPNYTITARQEPNLSPDLTVNSTGTYPNVSLEFPAVAGPAGADGADGADGVATGHQQTWTATTPANDGEIRLDAGTLSWHKNKRNGALFPVVEQADRLVLQHETNSAENPTITITGAVSFSDPIYSATATMDGGISAGSVRSLIETKGDPGTPGTGSTINVESADGSISLTGIETVKFTNSGDVVTQNGTTAEVQTAGSGGVTTTQDLALSVILELNTSAETINGNAVENLIFDVVNVDTNSIYNAATNVFKPITDFSALVTGTMRLLNPPADRYILRIIEIDGNNVFFGELVYNGTGAGLPSITVATKLVNFFSDINYRIEVLKVGTGSATIRNQDFESFIQLISIA